MGENLEARNCPNCGAPISGTTCEYCGTTFETETKKKAISPQEKEILERTVLLY